MRHNAAGLRPTLAHICRISVRAIRGVRPRTTRPKGLEGWEVGKVGRWWKKCHVMFRFFALCVLLKASILVHGSASGQER